MPNTIQKMSTSRGASSNRQTEGNASHVTVRKLKGQLTDDKGRAIVGAAVSPMSDGEASHRYVEQTSINDEDQAQMSWQLMDTKTCAQGNVCSIHVFIRSRQHCGRMLGRRRGRCMHDLLLYLLELLVDSSVAENCR